MANISAVLLIHLQQSRELMVGFVFSRQISVFSRGYLREKQMSYVYLILEGVNFSCKMCPAHDE
jgi:hypothetical protein